MSARKLRRAGRGSVAVIALLLLSSAGLRLASGVALAQDTAAGEASVTDTGSARTPVTGDRAGLGGLLDALREREERVAERERQIALRSKALLLADEEIAKRLVALEEAEAELRKTLSLADGAAENDIARLTAVYENMKAKDAAPLFEAMSPDFAAGFLARMRPDAAAAIMAGLGPDAAYSISVILAGRNARVPKS